MSNIGVISLEPVDESPGLRECFDCGTLWEAKEDERFCSTNCGYCPCGTCGMSKTGGKDFSVRVNRVLVNELLTDEGIWGDLARKTFGGHIRHFHPEYAHLFVAL